MSTGDAEARDEIVERRVVHFRELDYTKIVMATICLPFRICTLAIRVWWAYNKQLKLIDGIIRKHPVVFTPPDAKNQEQTLGYLNRGPGTIMRIVKNTEKNICEVQGIDRTSNEGDRP
jgi:hypothetical protein